MSEPEYKWDYNTPEKLRAALVRFASKAVSDDFRNDLMSLAWYYHTAILLEMNADILLRNIAMDAHPTKAAMLQAFADRDPQNKSMQAFALRIVTDDNGTYVEYIP